MVYTCPLSNMSTKQACVRVITRIKHIYANGSLTYWVAHAVENVCAMNMCWNRSYFCLHTSSREYQLFQSLCTTDI